MVCCLQAHLGKAGSALEGKELNFLSLIASEKKYSKSNSQTGKLSCCLIFRLPLTEFIKNTTRLRSSKTLINTAGSSNVERGKSEAYHQMVDTYLFKEDIAVQT